MGYQVEKDGMLDIAQACRLTILETTFLPWQEVQFSGELMILFYDALNSTLAERLLL